MTVRNLFRTVFFALTKQTVKIRFLASKQLNLQRSFSDMGGNQLKSRSSA